MGLAQKSCTALKSIDTSVQIEMKIASRTWRRWRWWGCAWFEFSCINCKVHNRKWRVQSVKCKIQSEKWRTLNYSFLSKLLSTNRFKVWPSSQYRWLLANNLTRLLKVCIELSLSPPRPQCIGSQQAQLFPPAQHTCACIVLYIVQGCLDPSVYICVS